MVTHFVIVTFIDAFVRKEMTTTILLFSGRLAHASRKKNSRPPITNLFLLQQSPQRLQAKISSNTDNSSTFKPTVTSLNNSNDLVSSQQAHSAVLKYHTDKVGGAYSENAYDKSNHGNTTQASSFPLTSTIASTIAGDINERGPSTVENFRVIQ